MSVQKAQDQTSETLGGYSSTDIIRNDSEKSNSNFSLKSESDLEKQVAKLAEQSERLREQLKVSLQTLRPTGSPWSALQGR